MRTIAAFMATCALLLTLCACEIIDKEPYRKVFYYDMAQPAADSSLKCPWLSGISVSSDIQYSSKMFFKTGPNRYEYDEYNRWVATPEVLLRRNLEQSLLAEAPSQGGRILKIEIRSFEMDAKSLAASCSVAYRLDGGKEPLAGVLLESATAQSGDAGAFAEAMREISAGMAAKLSAELKKLDNAK